MPTLFPIVPTIAEAVGIFPPILFTVINCGSGSAGIFPFSSGGSLILASAPDEDLKQSLYPRLMKCAVINILISIVLVGLVALFV